MTMKHARSELKNCIKRLNNDTYIKIIFNSARTRIYQMSQGGERLHPMHDRGADYNKDRGQVANADDSFRRNSVNYNFLYSRPSSIQ